MSEQGGSATVSREFEELGGEVTVSLLPGLKAQTLWIKLMRIVGPGMAQIVQSISRAGLDGAMRGEISGLDGLANGVAMIAERLTEEEFERIRKELLAFAYFSGQPVAKQADVLFQGKVLALFKVLAFVLEANFGDFFAAGRGVVASLSVKAPRPSEISPKPSPALGLAGG
jgi:hypothetical protein